MIEITHAAKSYWARVATAYEQCRAAMIANDKNAALAARAEFWAAVARLGVMVVLGIGIAGLVGTIIGKVVEEVQK